MSTRPQNASMPSHPATQGNQQVDPTEPGRRPDERRKRLSIITAARFVGHRRLTLGDPPPGAPPCLRCGEGASILIDGDIIDPAAYCSACVVELVHRGLTGT